MARSTVRARRAQQGKRDSTLQAVDLLNGLTASNEVSARTDKSSRDEADESSSENNEQRASDRGLSSPDREVNSPSWRDRLRRRPEPRRSSRLHQTPLRDDNLQPITTRGGTHSTSDSSSGDDAVSESDSSESGASVTASGHTTIKEEMSDIEGMGGIEYPQIVINNKPDFVDPDGETSAHDGKGDNDDPSPPSQRPSPENIARRLSPRVEVSPLLVPQSQPPPARQRSPAQPLPRPQRSRQDATRKPRRRRGAADRQEDKDWDMEDTAVEVGNVNEEAVEQSTTHDDLLLKEATQVLQQQENWADLVKYAHQILTRDPHKSVRYKSIEDINERISDLCKLYAQVQLQHSTRGRVGIDLQRGCQNLVEIISQKALRILTMVHKRATLSKSDPTQQTDEQIDEQMKYRAQAQSLFYELETEVVARLVKAAQTCLKAHYISGWLAAGGFSAVHAILQVISFICERSYTLKRSQVVVSVDLNRRLRPVVRSLLRAMEQGEFEQRERAWEDQEARPPASPVPMIDLEADEMEQEEDWTEGETMAVLDGLQMFQGPDRYQQLIRQFRDRLRGRTMAEVRAKARELRDSYVDAVGGEAIFQTEQGRREWAWLMSA